MMMRMLAIVTGLMLAGCVAPEPEPVPVRRAAPTVSTPLPANLEPAPMANRKVKPPDIAPVLSVPAGMGKTGGSPSRPAS